MSVTDLQRVAVKIFVSEAQTSVDPRELVPIFHKWIRTQAVDGLLIDVADYAHLPEGPGAVLIAHEGNYAFDGAGGRPGLQYSRKQPLDGPLATRLEAIGRILSKAARLLEEDPAVSGRLAFRGDELELIANDRLIAPNTDATFAALAPAVDAFLTKLYGPRGYSVERDPDPRERLTLSIRARETVSLRTLLKRIGD
jgi:hypothetical protein